MQRPRLWLLTATLMLAWTGTAPAIIPPNNAVRALARFDAHGDSLPPGALARLGRVDRSRHGSDICCLAVSRDGRLVATGGADGSLCLWDAASGRERRTWTGHDGPLLALAFSPDGKALASSSTDQHVRLWDVTTGKQTLRLIGHNGVAYALAFSPDGGRLLTGGQSLTRTVRIWDLTFGTELEPIIRYTGVVRAVTYTADNQAVIAGGDDQRLHCWSLRTGKELRTFEGHSSNVTALALTPDGAMLASGAADGEVRLWQTATARPVRGWQAHKESVTGLAYSGDGRLLASCATIADGVQVWEAATAKAREKCLLDSLPIGVGFGGGGRWLFAASRSGRLGRWELAAAGARDLQVPPSLPVRAVAFGKGGQVVTSTAQSWHCWDAVTMKELGKTKLGQAEDDVAVSAAPQADLLALSAYDKHVRGRVQLFQASTAVRLRGWALPNVLSWTAPVQLTADGKTLASAHLEQGFLWDTATGKQLARFTAADVQPGGTQPFLAFALSATGRRFAASLNRGPVRAWDVRTRGALATVGSENSMFVRLAFSPDDRILATLTPEGLVQFWDLDNGQERLRLPAAVAAPLLFSPDGRWFATGGKGGAIHVWDLFTGAETLRFTGHKDSINALAWRADGLALASGSRDGTALVWDLKPLADRPIPKIALDAPWTDLAEASAARAHGLIWALTARPKEVVAELDKRLQVKAMPGKAVAQLIAELDSPRFQVRDQASAELKKRGAGVQPVLQEALTKKPTLEVRQRLEKLLQEIVALPHSPEVRRHVRVVEVLERIGTPEARAVLARLAKGPDEQRLTLEARAALERFGRRWSVAAP